VQLNSVHAGVLKHSFKETSPPARNCLFRSLRVTHSLMFSRAYICTALAATTTSKKSSWFQTGLRVSFATAVAIFYVLPAVSVHSAKVSESPK
jgi:hypothetical protein